MTTSLTVTSKGQVTLRKDLLAHLGLRPGQRIDVEVLPGGRLELHAEQATASIESVFGLLAGRTERRASLEEMREAAAAGWAGQ
jgi:antitoxin PrlF